MECRIAAGMREFLDKVFVPLKRDLYLSLACHFVHSCQFNGIVPEYSIPIFCGSAPVYADAILLAEQNDVPQPRSEWPSLIPLGWSKDQALLSALFTAS